jgi:lipid-binding SYLF domain-containing protein
MVTRRHFTTGGLTAALAGLLPLPAWANEQQDLIDSARATLDAFMADPDMGWFRRYVRSARGMLIVPQLLKAGFIIGGEGGSGVLIARAPGDGTWSPPAFYTMGAGSIGLQIGAEASQVVLLLMTDKGVNSMLETNVKLGAEASVAAGPKGAGVEAATAPNLSADIISFSRSKGLFGGVSLEGAVVATRKEWNTDYYGQPVTSTDIIIRRSIDNPGTERLRQAAAGAAGAAKPS